MADSADIANRALSFLGERRITLITDSTKPAKACNDAFAFIRDEVFRSHPWNCLVARPATGLIRKLEAAKTITGITAANPPVVTAVAHGYASGEEVYIEDVVGMTEVNDTFFFITVLTVDTFSLNSTNATAYTAYTSGGTSKAIDVPANDFDYQYDWPADCLRVLTVDTTTGYEWVCEGKKILTDENEPLHITYIKQDTTVDNYDALLFEALAARLAVEIVQELTSSNTKAARADAWFESVMMRAMAVDGQEQSLMEFEDDTWISDRQ